MYDTVCPYCGCAMEKGYIENLQQPFLWSPIDQEISFAQRVLRKASKRKRQHRIGHYSCADGAKLETFFCRTCSIYIIFHQTI